MPCDILIHFEECFMYDPCRRPRLHLCCHHGWWCCSLHIHCIWARELWAWGWWILPILCPYHLISSPVWVSRQPITDQQPRQSPNQSRHRPIHPGQPWCMAKVSRSLMDFVVWSPTMIDCQWWTLEHDGMCTHWETSQWRLRMVEGRSALAYIWSRCVGVCHG